MSPARATTASATSVTREEDRAGGCLRGGPAGFPPEPLTDLLGMHGFYASSGACDYCRYARPTSRLESRRATGGLPSLSPKRRARIACHGTGSSGGGG